MNFYCNVLLQGEKNYGTVALCVQQKLLKIMWSIAKSHKLCITFKKIKNTLDEGYC